VCWRTVRSGDSFVALDPEELSAERGAPGMCVLVVGVGVRQCAVRRWKV